MEIREENPVDVILVTSGQFEVDRKAMEKRVNEQLANIVYEQLIPYKTYLQRSAKFLSAISGVGALGVSVSIVGSKFASNELCDYLIFLTSFLITGLDFIVLIASYQEHGFFLHPLYKLYRARKVFKQVTEELSFEAMNGRVDVTKLGKAFDLKIQKIQDQIKKQKKKEREDRKKQLELETKEEKALEKLIKRAKKSKL